MPVPRKNIALKDDFMAQAAQTLTLDVGGTAAGVIDLSTPVTKFNITGACTATMAAPTWSGQFKVLEITVGATTPVLVVTVTGTDVATQDVWTAATFVAASGPRVIKFESFDGATWVPTGAVGTWTVA